MFEARPAIGRLVVRPHQPAVHGLGCEHVLPCRVAFVHDAAQTVRLNVEIGQFEGCVEPLRIQHAVGGEVLQRRIEKRRHPFDPVGTAQHVDADHHLGGIGRIEERHEFGRLRCPAGLEQGDDDGAGKA